MKHLIFWGRRWIPVAIFTIAAPFFVIFSRAWRRKLQAAYEIGMNPYWDRVVSLSELVDDPLAVQIAPLKASEHNCSEFELLVLGALVKQTQSKSVFEIGTFDGRSTRTLALNASENGLITTLNLPPDQGENDAGLANVDSLLNLKVRSGNRFLGTPEEGRIKQIYGDSATFEFDDYRGQFDLIFIDGSHSEEYVEKDTETSLRLLRPEGGLIVWHDGPFYGVVRYLRRKIRNEDWPIKLVEGTTLMIGYARQGKLIKLPTPLPNATSAAKKDRQN
jgi:predicted O-methyltransferase YrrM